MKHLSLLILSLMLTGCVSWEQAFQECMERPEPNPIAHATKLQQDLHRDLKPFRCRQEARQRSHSIADPDVFLPIVYTIDITPHR